MVINLPIPDFNKSGHILTFPRKVKQKMMLLVRITFMQITFELRNAKKNAKHHRIPHVDTRQNIRILTSIDKFENIDIRSGKMTSPNE